jgi:carbonic anhydrase
MKRVFNFRTAEQKYHCDAVVVACFDHRFDLVLRKFLKRIGVVNPDPIVVAGGAKSLASPEHESDREFLLAQVEKSIRLHGTDRVLLFLHSDCGAYGGLHKAFNGSETAEVDHHRNELRIAVDVLKQAHPNLTAEWYFIDFAGVWQLDTGILPDSQGFSSADSFLD